MRRRFTVAESSSSVPAAADSRADNSKREEQRRADEERATRERERAERVWSEQFQPALLAAIGDKAAHRSSRDP